MFDFHYNQLKNKRGNKSKLFFTDTGSLMYKIEINEVYEDKFDFREYRENSKFHGKSNKNVIGQIKGKTTGFRIVDLVGLKSKMYSYIGKDDTGNNNATGIIKKRY